jgi:hypothetical protein
VNASANIGEADRSGFLTVPGAIEAIDKLLALVSGRLPLKVEGAAEEPMRLIGPALLVRGAGTLEAIGSLAALERRADAGVLLRVLLEHMIVFAWLSAEPTNERIGRWLKYDSKRRLAMHGDMPEGMPDLLNQQMHAYFDGILQTVEGAFPDLRTCAKQADEHWRTRLPGVLHPGNEWGSFLGLYQVVYRFTSAPTHAHLLGLQSVIQQTPDGEVIDMEPRSDRQPAVCMAPIAYTLGLYVSSAAQRWPAKESLNSIFA